MKIYFLAFIASLLTLGSAPKSETITFSCGDTTDSYAVYITDLAGNNVSGQVLSKQTYYKIVVDMNHSDCFKNTAYKVTQRTGMTVDAIAKDANCGDVEFTVYIDGVIAKPPVNWVFEVTPYGDDTVTGDPCLATHHAKSISGTAI